MILVSNIKGNQAKIKDGRIHFSNKISIEMNTQANYRSVEELAGKCFRVVGDKLIETSFFDDTDVILVHFKQDTPIVNLISSMRIQKMIYSADKTEAIYAVHINPMTTHTQDIRVIYKNPAGGHLLQIIRFMLKLKNQSFAIAPVVKLPFEYNNHKLESCYMYVDDNLKVKRNTSIMPKELIVCPGINAKIIQQELKRSFSKVQVMSESELLAFAQEASHHFTMYGFPMYTMIQARAYANINITSNLNSHMSSKDGEKGKLVATSEPCVDNTNPDGEQIFPTVNDNEARKCDCDPPCENCTCNDAAN